METVKIDGLKDAISSYSANGFALIRGLFTSDEAEYYSRHFMQMRESGPKPGDYPEADPSSEDPLKRFPRMIHMHRWDEISLKWLIEPRLNAALTSLLGEEPYAVQTMLYFKPPGARGQALHQDQFYLSAAPGTCMAAWMALDRCDEENGCMLAVPGSHLWPLLCPKKANAALSFTDVTVPLPEGVEVNPMIMDPGDVLFFHGAVVHGSLPNRTNNRFRRALIGHYITGCSTQVGGYYHPVLKMDGSAIQLGVSAGGGPCGIWVEQEGEPIIELSGRMENGFLHE